MVYKKLILSLILLTSVHCQYPYYHQRPCPNAFFRPHNPCQSQVYTQPIPQPQFPPPQPLPPIQSPYPSYQPPSITYPLPQMPYECKNCPKRESLPTIIPTPQIVSPPSYPIPISSQLDNYATAYRPNPIPALERFVLKENLENKVRNPFEDYNVSTEAPKNQSLTLQERYEIVSQDHQRPEQQQQQTPAYETRPYIPSQYFRQSQIVLPTTQNNPELSVLAQQNCLPQPPIQLPPPSPPQLPPQLPQYPPPLNPIVYPPVVRPELPPLNNCCARCGVPYCRRRSAKAHMTKTFQENSNNNTNTSSLSESCTSPELEKIIKKLKMAKAKEIIQETAQNQLSGGIFHVICAPANLHYFTRSVSFCISAVADGVCMVFRTS